MPFDYDKPDTSGDWVNMRDAAALCKKGEIFTVSGVEDDDSNTYKDEASPRFIVTSTVSSGEEVKTGVRKGYGRDDFFSKLQAHITLSGETVPITFQVATPGKPYIEADTAY